MTIDPTTSPWGKSAKATTALLATIVVALAMYLCIRIAWASMFSIFMDHDDEGSLLLVLAELAKGHALYDQVLSQYGPFAFLPKLLVVKLLGLSVNHDVGRILTVVCWLLTSAFSGLAAWKLGRSPAWFGVGAIAVCLTIYSIVNEPGHPQDICSLILSAAVVVAAFGQNRKRQLILLGCLGALLVMTKINLGAYYLLALGAAATCILRRTIIRDALMILIVNVSLGLPLLLMLPEMHQTWPQIYCLLVGFGLCICIFVATKSTGQGEFSFHHLIACIAAFFATVLLIVIATMAMGTTPAGLADGLFKLAWLTAGSFRTPAQMYPASIAVLPAGLILALLRNFKFFPILAGPLRIAASLFFLKLIADGDYVIAFNIAPAFGFLALLPVQPAAPDQLFARAFLAMLAIVELLGAYPVFGNQVSFAVFLPAILATITLADGICDLTSLLPRKAIGRGLRFTAQAAVLLETLRIGWLTAIVATNFHDRFAPLGLPGTDLIRIDPGDAAGYQLVTANLKRNCDIFYTLPGRNSFYFWTQMDPPTLANSQQWMYLLSEKQQMETIHALDAHPDACLLRNQRLIDFWTEGRSLPDGPLVEYFRTNFRLGFKIGDDEFWFRNERKQATEVNADGSETKITLLRP
jgi:hypothetical protein